MGLLAGGPNIGAGAPEPKDFVNTVVGTRNKVTRGTKGPHDQPKHQNNRESAPSDIKSGKGTSRSDLGNLAARGI